MKKSAFSKKEIAQVQTWLDEQDAIEQRRLNQEWVGTDSGEEPGLQNTTLDFLPAGPLGYGVAKGVHGAGQAFGNNMRALGQANRTAGVLESPGKRGANIALTSAFLKAADPTTIPRAIGDSFSMTNKSSGVSMGSKLINAAGKVGTAPARFKNYRMNRKAGATRESAFLSDQIAVAKLKMGRPKHILNKVKTAQAVNNNPIQNPQGTANLVYDAARY